MTEKLYAERDPMEQDKLGNYYCKHVSAMTSEDLHSKSAIAAELAHRDIEIDILTDRNKACKKKQAEWVSKMGKKENEVTKNLLQATMLFNENRKLDELNDELREQIRVFTELDTKGAEFGKYVLAMFQQHDILVKENRDLRVAMDYILRGTPGLVPSEADRFYNPVRCTFQRYEGDEEDFKNE